MTKSGIRYLTDHAVQCLTCACASFENRAARVLLQITDSLSSAGVLAAMFLGDSPEHEQIVGAARDAIREQRAWCRVNGPFRPAQCGMEPAHIAASNAPTSSK